MATIYGNIDGIMLEEEALAVVSGVQVFAWALVSFELGAYSQAADSVQLGAGGTDRGVSTTDSLATMIQKQRHDGKTVTLKSAMLARPGLQGTTNFYSGAWTVSGGNLTNAGPTSNDESTKIDAAAGIHDRPMQILVRYSLT